MKILSIDFDIIMYPCIKLYNQYVNGGENAGALWENLNHMLEIDKYLNYDANTYQNIFNLLIKTWKNNPGVMVFPITNHEEVVTQLKTFEEYHNQEHAFEITNIDFHHDIFYNEESLIDMCHYDKCTCANWLGFLIMHNKVSSLNWYKAPNSPVLDSSQSEIFDAGQYCDTYVSPLSAIDENPGDYDAIFLCLSPHWVPYKYHHLYDLYVNVLSQLQPDNGEAIPVMDYACEDEGEDEIDESGSN